MIFLHSPWRISGAKRNRIAHSTFEADAKFSIVKLQNQSGTSRVIVRNLFKLSIYLNCQYFSTQSIRRPPIFAYRPGLISQVFRQASDPTLDSFRGRTMDTSKNLCLQESD